MNMHPSPSSRLLSPVWRLGALLLIGAALLGLAACAQVATGNTPPPAPEVTAAPAVARDVTEWDEFTGRLEPVQSVAIRPRVSGLVTEVTFEDGRKGVISARVKIRDMAPAPAIAPMGKAA